MKTHNTTIKSGVHIGSDTMVQKFEEFHKVNAENDKNIAKGTHLV